MLQFPVRGIIKQYKYLHNTTLVLDASTKK